MRYPVVLLDAGETLLGPAEPFGAVYARVLADHGLDLPTERLQAAIADTARWSMREIPPGIDRYGHYPGGEREYWLRFACRVLESATGGAVDAALSERALDGLRDAFRSRDAWIVFPDVVPALDALRERGVRLGVVSNWDSRLGEVLEMLDLSAYFDAVGVSHLEGVEKPDPELFHVVLRRLDATPGDALRVGDIPELDGAGARAAGVDCVLVDRRPRLRPLGEGPLEGSPGGAVVPDLSTLPQLAETGLGQPRS